MVRSIRLTQFNPLFELSGVRFFSLQKNEGTEQLTSASPTLPITDLSTELMSWEETAAAVSHLDLVLTVDTAVAHLAGALAKPVWLLVSYVPDWRWLMDRDDSPWYPTMRLFRQRRPGDWAEVIDRVVTALRNEIQRQQRDVESRRKAGLVLDGAASYNKQGTLLAAQGNLMAATQCFRKALLLDSEDADAYFKLGTVLLQLGKPDEAAVNLEKCSKLRPDHIRACHYLGGAFLLQGQIDKAIACYRQALTLNPDFVDSHIDLGTALQMQRKLEEAISSFRCGRT